MTDATRRCAAPNFRLRRHPYRRRKIGLVLLIGVLSTSTVVSAVSANSLGQLPVVWQFLLAAATPPAEDTEPLSPPDFASDSTVTTDSLAVPAGKALDARETDEVANHHAQSQRVTLSPDDYVDSWLQAGRGPNGLGTIERSQQLRVDTRGRLRGRLLTPPTRGGKPQPVADVRLLLLHAGRLAATCRTDQAGGFEVTGLTTGTYALTAAADDLLLAFALHVQRVDDDSGDPPDETPLECWGIRGNDVATANNHISWLPGRDFPAEELIEPEGPLIPAAVRGPDQVGVPGTTLQVHPVQQQPEGHLIGRVRQLHPQSGRPLKPPPTEVALLRDGKVVATGRTDEQGRFATGLVEPGRYAVVATTLPFPDLRREDDTNRTPHDEHVSLSIDSFDRPGYAMFAVEVLPSISLVSGWSAPGSIQGGAASSEPLQLDFALIDAPDVVSLVHQRSLGRERRYTGNASRPPTGSRTAPQATATAPRSAINRPPSGSGGGGPVSFPILPPGGDGGGRLMSPALL